MGIRPLSPSQGFRPRGGGSLDLDANLEFCLKVATSRDRWFVASFSGVIRTAGDGFLTRKMDSTGQVLRRLGGVEFRLLELSLGEPLRSSEITTRDVRAGQVGIGQVGIGQVGISQMSVDELDALEIGPL